MTPDTLKFKNGDHVTMVNCVEAESYAGEVWECRTDSYIDKAEQEVVFLHGFTGTFMASCLKLVNHLPVTKRERQKWENIDVSTDQEYDPLRCSHRKPNGLTAFDLLSHSSGSGPGMQHLRNISVCLRCGEIRISGHEVKNDQLHQYSEEFSIDYPDAVAAIVKQCNFMNKETEGYIPFVLKSSNSHVFGTNDNKIPAKSLKRLIEAYTIIEDIYPEIHEDTQSYLQKPIAELLLINNVDTSRWEDDF